MQLHLISIVACGGTFPVTLNVAIIPLHTPKHPKLPYTPISMLPSLGSTHFIYVV